MHERLKQLAHASVARGCGFAALAIFCTMIGFAGDLPRLLKAGGYGAIFVALVLLLKASRTRAERYKKTELWLMLDRSERPPEPLAAKLVTAARVDAMLRWAYGASFAAAVLLGSGFLATFLVGR